MSEQATAADEHEVTPQVAAILARARLHHNPFAYPSSYIIRTKEFFRLWREITYLDLSPKDETYATRRLAKTLGLV